MDVYVGLVLAITTSFLGKTYLYIIQYIDIITILAHSNHKQRR